MDLLTVGLFLHVDEVDDNQHTDIAQAQLEGNFLDRFEVGFQDRVLEVVLADKATGVDIDGRQCFGLFDNDIAAAFQPDLAAQCPGDFNFEAEGVKNRLAAMILLDLEIVPEHEGVEELDNLLIFDGAVDDDPGDIFGQDVSQDLAGYIQVRVDQAGGVVVFAVLADLVP